MQKQKENTKSITFCLLLLVPLMELIVLDLSVFSRTSLVILIPLHYSSVSLALSTTPSFNTLPLYFSHFLVSLFLSSSSENCFYFVHKSYNLSKRALLQSKEYLEHSCIHTQLQRDCLSNLCNGHNSFISS